MSYEATVTSKGQITIPRDLRKEYELKKGEKVLLIPSKEGVILKHRVSDLKEIRGLMRREVDIKKASRFIRELRKKWRLGDGRYHNLFKPST